MQADGIRDSQWHLRFLNIDAAHLLAEGAGVTVAVIDTGVDRHPDLDGSVLIGTVTDPRGSGDGTRDVVGHGTGMAGLIAAHGHGPGEGVLGIAPRAQILPITDNATLAQGNGSYTADAVNWAIAHGADVINISSSGGHVPALKEAIDAAIAADIVVVAGVGNQPAQRVVGFPAYYPGVVAVGSVDRHGEIAQLSVSGKEVVIAAPGVDIMTTRLDGKYGTGSGTSDSTAIVAGAIALIRSRFPNLPASEVVRRLTATAIDKGAPGRDEQYGYGVLNLMGALTADVPSLSGSPTVSVPSAAVSDGVAAPEVPRGGGVGLAGVVGALVVVGGLITAFVLRGRARRRADGAGPVP